jgi:glucose-6-phosphate isomerase, archaeal
MALIPPAVPAVDLATGSMAGATRHYEKRFADLAGLYADAAAYAAMLPALADAVVYDVWEHRASEAPGDLVFGTSVMKPGQVGDEFFFTRGHQHGLADRAEIYHCLAGSGVMLIEHPAGEVRALPMTPQRIVYVPPYWIHRSVNTGTETLVTVFCYAADAGQDYGVIDRAGGMRSRVVTDGAGGWCLVDNPDWRPAPGPRSTP